ncbi:hypothetical protein ACQKLP_05910 [Chitinophaga sp. NPDC101104]|uniref:hypothetical protein n=1 Tax=Chitinophaga sp. NPDC101104 TaxID=3390561 RepID=UPI003CFDF0BE
MTNLIIKNREELELVMTEMFKLLLEVNPSIKGAFLTLHFEATSPFVFPGIPISYESVTLASPLWNSVTYAISPPKDATKRAN